MHEGSKSLVSDTMCVKQSLRGKKNRTLIKTLCLHCVFTVFFIQVLIYKLGEFSRTGKQFRVPRFSRLPGVGLKHRPNVLKDRKLQEL